jgi:hypothetical protein
MYSIDDIEREELGRQVAFERRMNSTACQCGSDMPGRCPGPQFCPMCETDYEGEEE